MPRSLLTFATILLAGALAAQATHFTATLTGAQEVPPSGSTTLGQMSMILDTGNSTLAYRVVVGKFATAPTAAHFHRAAAGVNGPVVIAITGGPSIYSGITRALTAAELADLRAGLWYVNVHTSQFPGGEIRGQISAATLPVTYGAGCMGSNAKIPAISGRDFPSPSNAVFQVGLTNAKESSIAVLLMGVSKTQYGALVLPFDLSIIGMPTCKALCDDIGIGGSTATDANGAAFMPVLIPFQPALVGITLYSQWYVVDPVANLLGLTNSNGLEAKIQ